MIELKTLTQDYSDDCKNVIRSAYGKDSKEVLDYFDEEFPSAFEDKSFTPFKLTYCGLFCGGNLVGFGAYAPSFQSGKVWELSWGTMHEDHQGKGYGHQLLDFRLDKIRKKRTSDNSFVTVHSTPSRLFLDNGFEVSFYTDTKAVMWKKL
jgi:GNAT superfamily N-acetyltransferase